MQQVLQALREAGYATVIENNIGAAKKDDRFVFTVKRIQDLAWWTFGISTLSGHEAVTVIPEERLDIKNIAYYESTLKTTLQTLEAV